MTIRIAMRPTHPLRPPPPLRRRCERRRDQSEQRGMSDPHDLLANRVANAPPAADEPAETLHRRSMSQE